MSRIIKPENEISAVPLRGNPSPKASACSNPKQGTHWRNIGNTIEAMERDLGCWGDIIGVISLAVIFVCTLFLLSEAQEGNAACIAHGDIACLEAGFDYAIVKQKTGN